MTHQDIFQDGQPPASDPHSLSPAVLIELYRLMLRLRRIEEAIIREYRVADEIKCPVHFTIGQEAVSSALTLFLRPEDHLYCHHRSHGYYLAKKCPLNAMLAELFGKETGANGGLAGSQEISHSPLNFNSGAILTGASSLAVGSALAFKLNQTDQIAVAGFGEAATEEGVFWEAINYASMERLPLIYLCENNKYSMYSPQLKRQPADNIHERVAPFGIRTKQIFGNDVVAVYHALVEAFQRGRNGEGPQFLEFYTYRHSAHVGPELDDQIGYRPSGEQNFWKQYCPISLLERQLKDLTLLTSEESEVLEGEIQDEISDGFQFARASSFPKTFVEKNYASHSSTAERLLPISELEEAFDAHQAEAKLAPY